MNLITFGLIFICCNVWAEETNILPKYGVKMQEKLLKKFKTILKTGAKTFLFPVFDPYNANQLKIELNKEIIKLNTRMTNVSIIGLSEYDIINVNFTKSPVPVLNLHLSWPLIVATTNYSMKGNACVFDIYGNGEMRMSAQNFAFDTTIGFMLTSKGMSGCLRVKDIKLKLSLKSLGFHVTGLYDNNELSAILSAIISGMAPELINKDKIVDKIIPLIEKQLNDFLYHKPWPNILNVFDHILSHY